MSFSKREIVILHKVMKSEDYITSQELAIAFDVSVRTIKSDVNKINASLNEYFDNTKIASKPRHGYRFESDRENIEEKLQEIFPIKEYSETIVKDNRERIYFIIRKLLVVDYPIKIEQFMDELFLSRTMLSSLLKEVRERLEKYHLKIVTIPHHGIIIEGIESNRRLAISEHFYHDDFNSEYHLMNKTMFSSKESQKEYSEVVQLIEEICLRYKIDLSIYNINNFAIHIIVGIRRALLYNYNVVEDLNSVDLIDSIEFKAATDIVLELEKRYELLLPIGETIYFANHLQTKRIVHSIKLSASEIEKLESCITTIIIEINNNFEFDFSLDGELYKHLYLHLPQMINRIRKNMIARNPLVYDNIRRYLFAAKVTHSACEIINQFYDVEVEINEFGYLLLYFNMAIFQFETSKPLNIAVLSGRGRPESLMYFNEIREAFSSKKYNIAEIDQFKEGINYDVVISTYDVQDKGDINLFVIEGDHYLQHLRDVINALRYRSLDIEKYFKREYFSVDVDGETKEEVTKNLYKILIEKELTKDSDLKKIKMMDSELGNGVVHLQDTYRLLKKGMFYLAILKKPVYWNYSTIRIIIITKTKKAEDKDLLNFCRVVSAWTSDKSMVTNLIKEKKFQVLHNDIEKILGE